MIVKRYPLKHSKMHLFIPVSRFRRFPFTSVSTQQLATRLFCSHHILPTHFKRIDALNKMHLSHHRQNAITFSNIHSIPLPYFLNFFHKSKGFPQLCSFSVELAQTQRREIKGRPVQVDSPFSLLSSSLCTTFG